MCIYIYITVRAPSTHVAMGSDARSSCCASCMAGSMIMALWIRSHHTLLPVQRKPNSRLPFHWQETVAGSPSANGSPSQGVLNRSPQQANHSWCDVPASGCFMYHPPPHACETTTETMTQPWGYYRHPRNCNTVADVVFQSQGCSMHLNWSPSHRSAWGVPEA